jgi:S-DNA-T family DNA segregation ATPase FtsK/SpoIIIE
MNWVILEGGTMAYDAPHADNGGSIATVTELRPATEPGSAPPAVPPAEQPGTRRQIVPHGMRRENIRATARQWAGLQAHRAGFHGVRSPWYTAKALWYAIKGGAVLLAGLVYWAAWPEGKILESQAVALDTAEARGQAMRAHTEGKKTRAGRWQILLGSAVLAAFLVLAAVVLAPWQIWPPVALIALVTLARYGRPHGQPIARAAVVPVQYEDLDDEIVFRALGSLGISGINDAMRGESGPGRGMRLVDPIHRDGPGYLANVDLPYGVTAAMVMDKREELASGLRRNVGCVWPEKAPGEHPGRLALWVGYQDMNKTPLGVWPLARRGTADLFKPAMIARDQRGRAIEVTLMFVSAIIGAVPRMGKTFLLRMLLLIAALDARAEVHAYDLKGTGDLACMERIAYRYRVGDDEEDIEYAIKDMRALREEMRRRTKVIRQIAKEHPELCPENKVTPELAARKELRLHPIVVGADECQVWFEHPKYGKEFESICTDLAKRGPALGIILILATQRPDAKSIPTGISANAVMRMCLKVMTQVANDQVLGQSMFKTGIKATMFAIEDKGIFYLAGEGAVPKIARGFNIDGPAADKIALRARALREQAGTLAGHCIGDEDADEPSARSFLRDVLDVFGENAKLYLGTIADRLREEIPEAYADIVPDAVGAQLRDLGVTVKDVREPRGPVLKGCERASAEAALAVREPVHV